MLSITTLRLDTRDADDGVLGWALTWSTFAHLTFVAALLALDQEAITAVLRWKFAPGRRAGVAVNVLVTAILDFTIR